MIIKMGYKRSRDNEDDSQLQTRHEEETTRESEMSIW